MAVRVVSRRTVRPAPRPRSRVPLTTWDISMLSADYIQKGLLYAPPPFPTARLLDHLEAALAEALAAYYPVAGRLATEQRPGGGGCSLSIDYDGQGVEILHAVANGVAIADGFPLDADVPRELVQSFFPLDGAVNHDGHHLPLLVVQVTDLADGVFLAFAYNHALSDGTALWEFLNVWAGIARARLSISTEAFQFQAPLLERWSPDSSSTSSEIVLPFFPDLAAAGLIERLSPPPLRERMLHFSDESLAALKERAREELLAAGDTAGAAAVTRFQALTSLVWRCVTRARRLSPEQTAVCHAAINNRSRLRPPLPREYFGNCMDIISTEAAAGLLLERGGHGWAAAAVGRAVAAHTDGEIRAHVAAWTANPVVYTLRYFEPTCVMMGSSPRFDMYGCDFGWGPPLAARSGRANKLDGQVYLYPGREGGIDAELSLTPDHMARLEEDDEFWAAVTPDKLLATGLVC